MNWKFDEHATTASAQVLSLVECHVTEAEGRTGEILRACASALRAEIDKSQRLLDAVDTVILGLDSDGRITLINRKGCEVLGYRDDELIGKSWFDTCLPRTEEAGVVFRLFRQIMSGELTGMESFENEVLTRSGERRIVAWHNNYFRAADGRILGTLSAGEDVTEQRQAEAALRESEARLDHLLTSSPTVIFSYRAAGEHETTFVSDNIRDQMGYTPEQCMADPDLWVDNIHPDDKARVLDSLSRNLKDGKYCDEYRLRHAEGTWRWIRDERKLLRDAEGRAEEVVGSWSDVTHRKAAEEQTAILLEENRRAMQRLFSVQEAERRRLARELHDEFGQWLSAVQANAEAVAGLGADRLADIHDSAVAISECVGEVQAGIRRLMKDLRPAVLDELGLQEGLREMVAQWQEHHPHLQCDFSVSGSLADANEVLAITIYRLVQEALTNVARHARARRAVVELRRQQGDSGGCDLVRLRIRDDGVGIDASNKRTGFGLLGMRERVLSVGGVYQMETGPGEGLTIDVILPLEDSEARGG